ncbi:MAG TPA: serine hydrolase [Acetobacteraceae bacterium]|nr:serine hydrolase [Acetobacteraceae bacterium]
MRILMLLFLLLPWPAWAAADPVFSDTGPEDVAYGANAGYPTRRGGALLPQMYMVGDYSRFDTLWPSHVVAKSSSPSSLRRADNELALTYQYAGGSYTLDDYLRRNPVTGLLIARDDTILFEHYQYDRSDRDRMLSQSMAKTITAMLLGIAVSEGAIRSIDQPAADDVPALADTEYGRTSIRNLLHMASGVAFHEVYDGADDSAKLGLMLFVRGVPPEQAVAQFNTREAPPGTRFHYAGAETETLGQVVSNAVRMPLAQYLQSRIWQPMGAEADATWVVDGTGHEVAYCCFNATLRDWARFGLILAHDGAWNGRQIIPRQWVLDATSVAAPYLAPGVATRGDGYGYQIWLLPGGRRAFALRGIHGQVILIDPTLHLVMVHMAVRLKASADPAAAEMAALWHALVAHFGG